MSCRRWQEIDAEGFLADPRADEWGDFRAHYPLCPECAAAVDAWTRFEVAFLGVLQEPGDAVWPPRPGAVGTHFLGALQEPGDAELSGPSAGHPNAALLARFQTAPAEIDEAERRTLAEHVSRCAACREAATALATRDVPQDAVEAVIRRDPRLPRGAAPRAPSRRFRWLGGALATAAACAVAALVTGPVFWTQVMRITFGGSADFATDSSARLLDEPAYQKQPEAQTARQLYASTAGPDSDAVRSMIVAYESAYAACDIEKLGQIWKMSGNDRFFLRSVCRRCGTLDVSVRLEDIHVEEGKGTIAFQQWVECTETGKLQRQDLRAQVVRRTGGAWQIFQIYE